jgi:hypothetical protein
MTEAEWLACANPVPMLEFLRGKADQRRLRLYGVACCRRLEPFPQDASKAAVVVAEGVADKRVAGPEWGAARRTARFTLGELCLRRSAWRVAEEVTARCFGVQWDITNPVDLYSQPAVVAERTALAQLLRDIFNPFRRGPVNPAWLRWNDGAVPRLAQAIYEGRAFDRLPILADALEDAGCTDADLLSHLRGPGPHVRGCWALDLILGKK